MILNKPCRTRVVILGEIWEIVLETKNPKFVCCDGYTDTSTKEMHIALLDPNDEDFMKDDQVKYRKLCIRHEILHAYLYESGLEGNAHINDGPWAQNEEMIDWIAIQFDKIKKTYESLDI